MADVGVLQLSIQDNSSQAAGGLVALAGALERVRTAIGNGIHLEGVSESITRVGNAINTAFSDASIERVNNMVTAINRLSTASNRINGSLNAFAQVTNTVNNAVDEGGFRDVAASTNEAAVGVQNLTDETRTVAATIGEAAEETNVLGRETEEATGEMNRMCSGVNSLRGAFTRMFPTLSSFISSAMRIARMRFIRAVIKEITGGISEGVENAYRYSQKLGSSFATNMDSAASSLLQMKNSIGAALMPVLETLIPYLQTAVNWFIELVNYANQFVALMRGQSTWTKATTTSAKAFDDVKNSAKGASSAIKDLLADWDELNIIQSETGSSGSGTGTKAITDYLNMFEEVDEYNDKIKDVVAFIKSNFETIKDLVTNIGLAILAWKISNGLTGFLSTLATMATIGFIIKVAVDATEALDNAYIESDNIGALIGDSVIAGALAGVAGYLANARLGETAGYIAAGLVLAVSAGTTFSKVKDAKNEAQANMLQMTGGIKAGIAWALFSAGFIASGVAEGLAIAGGFITVALITYITYELRIQAEAAEKAKEMARRAFAETGSGGGINAQDYITALQSEFDKQTAGSKLILDAYVEVPDLKNKLYDASSQIAAFNQIIFNGKGKLSDEDAEAFKTNWEKVIETLNSLNTNEYGTILAGLTEAMSSKSEELRASAEEIRTTFIMLEKNISAENAEIYKEMERLYTKIASGEEVSEQDLKDYEKYYRVFAAATETGMAEIEAAIEKGKTIDFGDESTAVENAKEFIKTVGESTNAAIEEENEALAAVQQSIASKIRIETAKKDEGLITEEEYNKRIKNYNDILETVNNLYNGENGKIAEINAKMQDAYDLVFRQALSSPNANTDAYWEQVLLPLMREAKEAGYSFPDELIQAYTEGINSNYLDFGTPADSFLKQLEENGIADPGQIASALEQLINNTFHEQENLVQKYVFDILFGKMEEYGLNENEMEAKDLLKIEGWDLLSEEWKQDYVNAFIEAFGVGETNKILQALGVDDTTILKYFQNSINPTALENGLKTIFTFSPLQDMFYGWTETGRNDVGARISKIFSEDMSEDDIVSKLNDLEDRFGYSKVYDALMTFDPAKTLLDKWLGRDTSAEDANLADDVKQDMEERIAEAIEEMTADAEMLSPFTNLGDTEIPVEIEIDPMAKFKHVHNRREVQDEYFEDLKYIKSQLQSAMESDISDSELYGWLLGFEHDYGYDKVNKIVQELDIPAKVKEQWAEEGNKIDLPGVDSSGMQTGADEAASSIEGMANRIRAAISSLDGITVDADLFGTHTTGGISVSIPVAATPAYEGGIFTSGDIFTANENGRAEMIGSFGSRTAVANNEQIVSGISSGVAQANTGVESRLDTIENLMIRILNKEFTARAVPNSSWGAHNTKSNAQYSKVTGVY